MTTNCKKKSREHQNSRLFFIMVGKWQMRRGMKEVNICSVGGGRGYPALRDCKFGRAVLFAGLA
jgi:hypothetical protein